jgi:hypothetical protein
MAAEMADTDKRVAKVIASFIERFPGLPLRYAAWSGFMS